MRNKVPILLACFVMLATLPGCVLTPLMALSAAAGAIPVAAGISQANRVNAACRDTPVLERARLSVGERARCRSVWEQQDREWATQQATTPRRPAAAPAPFRQF